MAADPDEDGRGRLPVRVLVIVLVAQLLLAAVIIWFSVNGWPFIGGGRDAEPVRETTTARRARALPRRGRRRRADAAGGPLRRGGRVRARCAGRCASTGARPAGSPALRRLAADLRGPPPRWPPSSRCPATRGCRTSSARIPGRRPAIVVAAHYDVEARPEGFVGANDGAAGTAAVVGVARALRRAPRPAGAREVRFVLFDGEEEPPGSTDFRSDALRGSGAYARAHAPEIGSDRPARLRRPTAGCGSRARAPRTARCGRGCGRPRGASGRRASFPPGAQGGIIDDHTPFLDEGVPAIDLIDFAYPWRDTLRRRPHARVARSLDVTGETVTDLLLRERVRR